MVRYHHRGKGHEFEQTPGDSRGQGSLVPCIPGGCKELDTTQQLSNNTDTVVGCNKCHGGKQKICTGRDWAGLHRE